MSKAESLAGENLSSKQVSIFLALFPVIVLIAMLGINVWLYADDASYGPNQIALLMSAGAAALVGMLMGKKFKVMLDGIVKSLGSAIGAMLILLLIGSLAGTWMMSGIVPAMIYYGLDILNPQIFLVATLVICSIVSVATGSSWSTVATVGIALIAIGTALDVSAPITAGAIISGAYFGDKISPLSDTTNLASAMAGTNLFTHIRYMLWTTVPSILIATGIFAVIGMNIDSTVSTADTEALREVIASRFNISIWLLLVPVAVIVMVILKFDALVALFIGTLLGAAVAICVQPHVITEIANLPKIEAEEGAKEDSSSEVDGASAPREQNYALRSYAAFINAMAFSTNVTGNLTETQKKEAEVKDAKLEELLAAKQEELDDDEYSMESLLTTDIDPVLKSHYFAGELLKGKGMEGMLNTIWLIICAMCFGGVMEGCGLLQRLTQPLIQFAKSTGSLIATTAASCLFVNVTASDQYLAIVVPGRMFRDTYRDRGLAPQNLSRTLEDSGTVTSVLVPWNTCGVTQAGVLGVTTMAYAPYCFFNLASPLMTIAIGFIGIGIAKLAVDSARKSDAETDTGSDSEENA